MASVHMGPAFQLADRIAERQRAPRGYDNETPGVRDCVGHPVGNAERGRWPMVLAFYACELAQLDCPWGVERDDAVYACSGMYSEAAYEWSLGQLTLTEWEPYCRDLWRTEQWTVIHKDTGNIGWDEIPRCVCCDAPRRPYAPHDGWWVSTCDCFES